MITARQIECLVAIRRLGNAPPPSLRELGAELLVSHEAARLLVRALAEAGAVEVASGRSRALRVLPAGLELLEHAQAPAPELPDVEHRQWRNRYLFAHARDAIRCWGAHRDGLRVDRARGGSGGGRTPAIEDVARVGRVLAGFSGEQLGTLIGWARGTVSQRDQRVRWLVEQVTVRLQRLRIVGTVQPQPQTHRAKWKDAEGQEHETASVLEVAQKKSCDLAEHSAD